MIESITSSLLQRTGQGHWIRQGTHGITKKNMRSTFQLYRFMGGFDHLQPGRTPPPRIPPARGAPARGAPAKPPPKGADFVEIMKL